VGLLAKIHQPRHRAADTGPLSDFWYAPAAWSQAFQNTGVVLTPELALTLSALWFGVTFFSRNLGSLPCITYRNLVPTGKERAKAHPLYEVLRYTPNGFQTAFEFWEQCVGHILLRGNFYARILEGRRGPVDHLEPIHPDLVTVGRLANGQLQYSVRRLEREPEILTQAEVFHVKGFSRDGLTGLSVVEYAAQSLGTAVAADAHAGKFFKSGATAALAIRHPGVLGTDGAKNLRDSINKYLYGARNLGGVLVLEENAAIEKIGVSPQDAQILSTRQHSVEEVAAWLGLPIQIFPGAKQAITYASAYQFRLDLVDFAFRPMAVRIEQVIRQRLILRPEQYVSEFLVDAILRGDPKQRSEFYHFAILDGWMSRAEVRAKENLNPGDQALEEFLEPGNMRTAGNESNDMRNTGAADEDDDEDDDEDVADVAAHEGYWQQRASVLALEAARRVVRKEIAAVSKKAVQYANDAAAWRDWVQAFYRDHAPYVAETLQIPLPEAEAYAAHQGRRLEHEGMAQVACWERSLPPQLARLSMKGSPNGDRGIS
jgi:HK97 family phage portal protein